MRMTMTLGLAIGAVLSLAVAAATGTAAHADPTPYSISTTGGTLVVTVSKGYHINKEFPWKITAGATPGGATLAVLDKSLFEETKAKHPNPPKGTNTLKGAYCSVDDSGKTGSCTPFTTTITVP